jgi:hypothetical protein
VKVGSGSGPDDELDGDGRGFGRLDVLDGCAVGDALLVAAGVGLVGVGVGDGETLR